MAEETDFEFTFECTAQEDGSWLAVCEEAPHIRGTGMTEQQAEDRLLAAVWFHWQPRAFTC